VGIFDIFRREKKQGLGYAQSLNGPLPIYTVFGHDVYASDAVQSAIQCIVQEMKKLSPQHVRKGKDDKDTASVFESVQHVLDNPNPVMTTSELIERTVWQLYLRYNAFIIPTFTTSKAKNGEVTRRYTGLYPVSPTQVDFEEDASGSLYVHFMFPNSFETTLAYEDVIHVRYRYSVNEYMGGNEWGQPDNEALAGTLELNRSLLDGIAKAMQAGGQVNGVVKYNSMLDRGKTEANLKEFNEMLSKSASGFLALDLKAEFVPIKRDMKFVDADTVRFIDEKVLRYFGVPLPILTGDFTTQQFEAFYSKTLEPLVISLSQAFTKALFTKRERSYGNRVIFNPAEMVFMTTAEKLEMARILGDAGLLYANEARRAFGLAPIPELEGVRMVSLNYINSDIADEYQLGAGNAAPQEKEETNAA
jgi:HK97 family phage portal protein